MTNLIAYQFELARPDHVYNYPQQIRWIETCLHDHDLDAEGPYPLVAHRVRHSNPVADNHEIRVEVGGSMFSLLGWVPNDLAAEIAPLMDQKLDQKSRARDSESSTTNTTVTSS